MNDPASEIRPGETERRALEAKINALLPPRYVGCFEDVSPTSMGSAALRYDAQGRIVWGEIWTTFCHLAVAGGPPHRGRLLEPVSLKEVESLPEEQRQVVAELERGLGLAVELPLSEIRQPGWIGIRCRDAAMASWLVRAIVAENVIARHEHEVLFVPAGPRFRVEKEIKNVIVSVAKTCHYLLDHLEPEQVPTGEARPLISPPLPDKVAASPDAYSLAASRLEKSIQQATGLKTTLGASQGWLGVECANEEMAVWLLRAVAVEDVLVRREDSTLFVPIDLSERDESPLLKTTAAVAAANRLWNSY